MDLHVDVIETGVQLTVPCSEHDTVGLLKQRIVEQASGVTTAASHLHSAVGVDVLLADGAPLLADDADELRSTGLCGGDVVRARLLGDEGIAAQPLSGHTDSAAAACISPCASRVYTASHDSTARIWNASTGSLLHTTQAHRGRTTAAALTHCGTRLYTGGTDDTIRQWLTEGDSLTPAPIGAAAELTGHKDWVTCIALYPASAGGPPPHTLYSGGADGVLKVWCLSTGACEATLRDGGGAERVFAVAVSGDGEQVFTGGGFGTVVAWGARGDRERRATLQGHQEKVSAAVVSPDSAVLYTASCDASVRVWDAQRHAPLRSLAGHSGWVTGLALCPLGAKLYSCGQDGALLVWDVSSPDAAAAEYEGTLTQGGSWFTSLSMSPKGGYVMACSTSVSVFRAADIQRRE